MGIDLFRRQTTIDFVGMRHWAYGLSALCIALGLVAILLNGGLRYGVDFAGGVAVQMQFAKPVADENIKTAFEKLNLPGLAVQQYGDDGRDYLVRFSTPTDMAGDTVRPTLVAALDESFTGNEASIQRLEMVGPKVGADLRNAALEAMFFAILLITVYISGRFEHRWVIAAIMAGALGGAMYLMGLLGLGMSIRVMGALGVTLVLCWKLKLNFALGAIVGLLHDVLITVGLLTFMGKEFDLNIIAALLTLVGYSLNDTIIVYDRIRENLRRLHSTPSDQLPLLADVINASVNQTLGRTVMTSFTTLVACMSLVVLGGGAIHDFAITMLIGLFIGTFSSVFVSNPVLLLFGDTQQYLMPVKEEAATYERPGEHGMV